LADIGAKFIVYWATIQQIVAPSNYFRDPLQLPAYLANALALPHMNNELPQKNPDYKARITRLEHFRMFKWLDDDVVYPKESEWFGQVDMFGYIIPLEDQPFYKEDWLGLRTLEESGRISKLELPGGHMHVNSTQLDEVLIPLLK